MCGCCTWQSGVDPYMVVQFGTMKPFKSKVLSITGRQQASQASTFVQGRTRNKICLQFLNVCIVLPRRRPIFPQLQLRPGAW